MAVLRIKATNTDQPWYKGEGWYFIDRDRDIIGPYLTKEDAQDAHNIDFYGLSTFVSERKKEDVRLVI